MIKIDSHQHFWKYDPQKHSWISDEMGVLKRDFLPGDLKIELDKNDMDACVAVQADQSEDETNFLVNLAKNNPFIKGVVGWVDLRSNQVEASLEKFRNEPLIKGFRHVVQDEPDPDFMLGAAFQNGINALQKYGYTYDILIYPQQLPATISMVQKFQNQPFIIDHIAKPHISSKSMDNWQSSIKKLGEFEHVYCKLSGMVTEAQWKTWKYEDFEPYLDVVFEAFKPERLVFGSDWPVCLLSAAYVDVKSIIEQYIWKLSEYEQNKIMGLNASHFYQL